MYSHLVVQGGWRILNCHLYGDLAAIDLIVVVVQYSGTQIAVSLRSRKMGGRQDGRGDGINVGICHDSGTARYLGQGGPDEKSVLRAWSRIVGVRT